VPIEPHETLIRGEFQIVKGRMVADPSVLRIRALIDTELEKIGSASGGWEALYRDRRDGRFWEHFYPNSEMQGGGPESLRSIDSAEAAHKYGVTLGASVKRDIDFIIEQLIASIPGILIEQLKVAHPGADDVGLWIINIPDREIQVQIEASEGSCPFLIESDFNDERFHGHTVQEVVETVKRLFSIA
jgi:hypothetical protein